MQSDGLIQRLHVSNFKLLIIDKQNDGNNL